MLLVDGFHASFSSNGISYDRISKRIVFDPGDYVIFTYSDLADGQDSTAAMRSMAGLTDGSESIDDDVSNLDHIRGWELYVGGNDFYRSAFGNPVNGLVMMRCYLHASSDDHTLCKHADCTGIMTRTEYGKILRSTGYKGGNDDAYFRVGSDGLVVQNDYNHAAKQHLDEGSVGGFAIVDGSFDWISL
jgi:hypothetical protein